MSTLVDHLVVAAPTLADGAAWCEATLGVAPVPGGRHALMGTHNRLLRISSAAFPHAYLEIIAIDPDAPPPGRPRWFGLDTLDLSAGPRLIHFVARSSMLDAHRRALVASGCRPGEAVRAGRDTPAGRLEWDILLRRDGGLDAGGALPTLIQWHGPHPAATLPVSGVALASLALNGIADTARAALALHGVQVSAGSGPALAAVLSTPSGEVTLRA